MAQSVFEVLSAVDVSGHIEEKNGLKYLSWAWAWIELKKYYPKASYKVYEKDDGRIYWDDGRTAWVKVSVTVEGLEQIEYLYIMDNRNQPIPVERVTSAHAVNSIQRAVTKAIARHGLGVWVYAGEDLPETVKAEKPKEKTVWEILADRMQAEGVDGEALMEAVHSRKQAEDVKDIYGLSEAFVKNWVLKYWENIIKIIKEQKK